MQLQLALGSLSYHAMGGAPQTIAAFASARCLAEERQENFPDEIYHVYTFAMR